jgi:hypothetical protein
VRREHWKKPGLNPSQKRDQFESWKRAEFPRLCADSTETRAEQSAALPACTSDPEARLCICAIISTYSTEIYTHAAATNKRASELPAAQVQLMSCLYQNVTSVLHTHYCHHHSLDTVTVNTAKGCLSTNSTARQLYRSDLGLYIIVDSTTKEKKWPTRGLRRPVANCTESRQKKTRYISVSKGVISWFSRNLWKSDKFVLNK